ncbi:WecB/TagA/CpsF family glycosyltransferase [Starkeya sp. 3C]|uniref:WecB/TagA/CpsF family glycosyltransferase n=1 Tax=Ancylobacter moscoviensis TaxID=2597768 RepID=A0ABY3DSJ3_9HYPH|nr:WecB/TagA/CpsF family glycosyltransferase [Ancylobacter moscoviensis]TSJ62944.1 WecB/TagA/CpsF family glycosyltransferase [Ancylobacter moscoviensis]
MADASRGQAGGQDGGNEAFPPPAGFEEVTYLGVRVARLDAAAAAACIAARPADAPYVYVVTPNAAHFTLLNLSDDARFRDAYDHAWMRLLDGQVPRALARLLFGLDLPHAAGSDVALLLLERHIGPDDPVTLIGGSPEVPRRLAERFGLRRIAHHNPPMGFINRPDEVAACVDFVLANPARFVFFGVGTPQGEYLAREVALRGGATGCGLCVGGALNFATGITRRAPAFVRKAGLEWAHRLVRNPAGHARRVFVDSLPVVWIALKARLNPAAYGMGRVPADGGAKDRA